MTLREDSGENSTAKPTRSRLPKATWVEIKRLVCAGRRVEEVAKAYGVKPTSIYTRGQREKWPTPQRERQREIALERTLENAKSQPTDKCKQVAIDSQCANANNLQQEDQTALISLKANELVTIARETPERFDQAAGEFAQAMVALGMREVPAPRTIAELVKWESLRRQFLKLDDKAGAPGGMFDPVRPMRRAPVTMEAETVRPSQGDADPLDGFEP